jgi:hypothetical protein
MVWHIYEKTRYDQTAGKTVPIAWHVTWNVYTNPPETRDYNSSRVKIAGQDNKPFTDKAAAEKYLNGRIAAYSHLFTEIAPPIPKEYARAFTFNGLVLPGYSVAEDGLSISDLRSPASKTSVLGQIAGARESKRRQQREDSEPSVPEKKNTHGQER